MSETEQKSGSYVLAARRSAIARIGGLHRARRIEELAAPVIGAVLVDARLGAKLVDALVVGNTTAGHNPARMIGLSAGLAETVPALTVDRQSASGLDALLTAARMIAAGDAAVVITGGVESPSTAPWRLGRPRGTHQQPHVLALDACGRGGIPRIALASDRLAKASGIGRGVQDLHVARSAEAADQARIGRRFMGEIVPLRGAVEEARDQGPPCDVDTVQQETPFDLPDGTATPANVRALADGAAFAVVVSGAVWSSLGRPPALRLTASAACGVASDAEATAPMVAAARVIAAAGQNGPVEVAAVELDEESAAQAIAFQSAFDLADGIVNADGGALVRGHPLGASGGVLVARLFTRLVRTKGIAPGTLGLAAQGAGQGLGVAALFERV
jgi:acetyl-CoA C-acetyltransferase